MVFAHDASSLVIFCRRCPSSAISALQVSSHDHDTFVHRISHRIDPAKSSDLIDLREER